MTPKEKATELVSEYEKLLFNKFTSDEDWVKCIECAIIAVNEILKDTVSVIAIMYWEEVKKEIELL